MAKSLIFILIWIFTTGIGSVSNNALYEAGQLSDSGKLEEARNVINNALITTPLDVNLMYNLGHVEFGSEQYEESGEWFINAAKLTDDASLKFAGYFNAGNAYIKAKNWDAAIRIYTEALKVSPGNSNCTENLAFVLRQKKEEEKKKKEEEQKQQEEQENQQNQQNQEEQQDPSDEQQQNQEQQNDPGTEQRADQGELTEQEVEDLMKYLEEREKQLQEQIQELRARRSRTNQGSGKDW